MGAFIDEDIVTTDPGDYLPAAFNKVNNTHAILEGTSASLNIGIRPIPNLSAVNIQEALEQITTNAVTVTATDVVLDDTGGYFPTNNAEAALANLGLFRYRTVETNADNDLVYIHGYAETINYSNDIIDYVETTVDSVVYRQTFTYGAPAPVGAVYQITATAGAGTWVKTFTYNQTTEALESVSDWVG